MLQGDLGLVELAASKATALVQNEMGDLHWDLGKLDNLMDMVRLAISKLPTAA